jgi:hypothetical protein
VIIPLFLYPNNELNIIQNRISVILQFSLFLNSRADTTFNFFHATETTRQTECSHETKNNHSFVAKQKK